MSQKILIVDDEKKIRNILTQILRDENYITQTASSGEEAIEKVDTFKPDLILMDQKMPGIDGFEAMTQINEKYPESTIIIITAHGSIPLAVQALKKGAYDYISKPFDNDELLIVIRRALERNKLTEEITNLKKQLQEKYSFRNIIGVSTGMQRVFEQMYKVCDTNATVLIQGESGTGKELVARAVHFGSKRKNKPFVAVNCGAIPINLLESEFFGHEKGAFTDAKELKIGKFEEAEGGTIFLDEVGELPNDAQVKLLRVLDERKITRLSGKNTIPIDIRVIAATNRDLQKEVDQGNFRLDLFYRLNIFTISIPPLKDRKHDIPLLAENFIEKYNHQLGLNVKSISKVAMNNLLEYNWPGNVRDLENAIQSAMIITKNEVIKKEDLPMRIKGFPEVIEEKEYEEKGLEAYSREIAAKVEKEIILRTLETYNQNRTKTADKLKISRKTLFNKMKQYDLIS